jgi:Outer membrane protein beta-barrel domain
MNRILLRTLFFIFISVSSISLKAQYYFYNENYYERDVNFEVGGSVGFMNCLTDLGGKKGIGKGFIKDLNGKNHNLSFGIFATATYRYVFGVRLEATFGKIEAADSVLKPVAPTTFGRYERNLSFRSPITEIQLSMEFHPVYLKVDYDKEPPLISPYLIGGIGYFNFNPQAKLGNQWYDLKPLRLEGQGFTEYPTRKEYKLSQMNMAFGFGLKYEMSQAMNARLEIVHRKLYTDYLDDVSTRYINPNLFANYLTPTQAAIARQLHDRQGELTPSHTTKPNNQRGDPKDNDSYFSMQAKISFVIGRLKRTRYN